MKQDRISSGPRAPRHRHSRGRLLAGVATLACAPLLLAGQALAQDATPPDPGTVPADGLPPEAVYMDAGSVSRDGDVLTAEGTSDGARVFARFRDHTLQARRIDYDLANQTASC